MSRLRALVLGAVIAAPVLVSAGLAAGATSTPPAVTTAAATSVTDTAATLNGTVNPNGQQTQYAFQWGPTAGYGHETALTSAGAGGAAAPVSAALSGLSSGSTFHFRTIAISSAGTSVGADQTFTTSGSAPAPSPAPSAATSSASSVSGSGATLRGSVTPGGQSTTYYFEYGTTVNYGFETAPASAGSGTSKVSATTSVTGLVPSTTYHFRLVAVSAGGTALGADQTLTTPTPPQAITGGASKVDSSSAVLNATINPQGHSTTYFFQFGTTTSYGLQTPPAGAGSGTANIAVNRALEGLIPSTTYHYRIVAQNVGGTTYGADRAMRTSGPVQTPSHMRVLGRMGFVSHNGWVGIVIGCFGGETRCTGRFSLTHGRSVVGQRNVSVAPSSGGFQNVRLTASGRRLFGRGYRRPVRVTLNVTTTSGQHISQTMSLARWR